MAELARKAEDSQRLRYILRMPMNREIRGWGRVDTPGKGCTRGQRRERNEQLFQRRPLRSPPSAANVCAAVHMNKR